MNTRKILKQILRLQGDGKHQKVLNTVDGYPLSDLTPEIKWATISSCLALAKKNASAADRAVELLDSFTPEEQESPQWLLSKGQALSFTGSSEGRELLLRAQKLDPDLPGLKEALYAAGPAPAVSLGDGAYYVENNSLNPVSWKSTVNGAWDSFLKHESKIRSHLDEGSGSGRREARKLLRSSLPGIDTNLHAELTDGKYHLWIGTGTSLRQAFCMTFFRDMAPEAVREHWILHAGMPAAPDRAEGKPCGFRILPPASFDARQRILISQSSASRKAKGGEDEDEGGASSPALETARAVLGDAAYAEMISLYDVQPLSAAPEKATDRPVQELPAALREQGLALPEDTGDALARIEVHHRPESATYQPGLLRADIAEGLTRCPLLYQECLTGYSETSLDFAEHGVFTGFFAIPAANFPQDRLFPAMRETLDAFSAKLLEATGPDCIKVLGWGAGKNAAYLDVVAWDYDTVQHAAEQILKEMNLYTVDLSNFCMDQDGICLNVNEKYGFEDS